jgi:hypothetical protein
MLNAQNVGVDNNGTINIVGGSQTVNNFISSHDAGELSIRSWNSWKLLTEWQGRERRDIALWLSPLNFKASQSEFQQTHEQGTGNWLLESQTFQDWRNGTSRALWCPGNRKT